MGEIKIVAAGFAIFLCAYALEVFGTFLYIGYPVVRGGAIAVAVIMVAFALLVSHDKRWAPVLIGILIAMLLGISGWRLESFRSSVRKEFYLASSRVKVGMTLTDARAIMAPYRSFVVENGTESFAYRSGPQTEDVLVIRYDPVTRRVVNTDLSLD